MAKKVLDYTSAQDVLLDSKPEAKTFLCAKYPSLRVLLKRNAGLYVADEHAQFVGGAYSTEDPEAIEVLRRTPDVIEWNGKWYDCMFCGFKTRFPSGFIKHMKQTHPENA
jgi:hypothetical protein